MSQPSSSAHAHAHEHEHEHQEGAHGTLRGYLIGFLLSVILTAIPFALVMGNVFENSFATSLLIMGFAVAQIVVHMVYFLHMNARAEGGWSLLALIFTIVIVFIMIAGSLWVMYNLNKNMMPPMDGMETAPIMKNEARPML